METILSRRATAWLTDSEKWESYTNGDAVFAIGSPTAELFAASYNNRSNKTNTIELKLDTNGYNYNTSTGWLNKDENNGIYNKDDTTTWWLASPSSKSGTVAQLAVYSSNGYFSLGYATAHSFPVRPIACIPTSVFNEKYLSTLE